jgi:ArsR family metal-binding transcriptional regulator
MMPDVSKLVVFSRVDELEKAKVRLDGAHVAYRVVCPDTCYENVGIPALVIRPEAISVLFEKPGEVYSAGFVDFRESPNKAHEEPETFRDDVFGKAVIQVLSPCIADETKIRLIAHLSGNILPVMPYLNASMGSAFYNHEAGILTFMEQYRLVSVYGGKIAIAKADDIFDAWRLLEKIRRMVNKAWQDRSLIVPSVEMRKKPPALEIYYRLPRINCGQCGLSSCMAFALTLWGGGIRPSACLPMFQGEYSALRDSFLDICSGFIPSE